MSDDWTEADDAVEEVRAIRRQIWAEFDDDPKKLIAFHMELDKRFAQRMSEPWTSKDDIVGELREIQRQIWEEFGNDPERLLAHFTELEKQRDSRVSHTPPPGKKGKSAA